MPSTDFSVKAKRTVVSSQLTLWENSSEEKKTYRVYRTNPLVLLYPWLNSKPRTLKRFRDLYMNNWGYDVLIIQTSSSDVLWPAKCRMLSRNILEYIMAHHSDRPLLVHCFSVGCYTYTVCSIEIIKSRAKYNNIASHIQGQVFDSVAIGGLQNTIDGIAKSAIKNAVIALLIKNTLTIYYTLIPVQTIQFYREAALFFKEKVPNVQTHIFHSTDDPFCDHVSMKQLIDIWKNRGLDLTLKCWEKSEHCGHIRNYPVEYIDCLKKFVSKFEKEYFKRLSKL